MTYASFVTYVLTGGAAVRWCRGRSRLGLIVVAAIILIGLTATPALLPPPIQQVAHAKSDTQGLRATSVAVSVPQRREGEDPQQQGSNSAGEVTPHQTIDHPAGFSALGVTWERGAFAPDATFSIRTRDGGGVWSQWRDLAIDAAAQSDKGRGGTELAWTGPAVGVEVKGRAIITAGAGADPDLRVELIDPGHEKSDTAAAVVPKVAPAQLGNGRKAATTMTVQSRASWGADPKYMTWGPEYAGQVEAVAIHHTATGNDYQPQDVPGIMRSIYYYQAVTEKWGDIGYSVLVDKFGRAWEGRSGGLDRPVVGAHILGFNTGTSSIAFIGNYVEAEPSDASLETAAQFIAYKLGASHLDPRSSVNLTGGPNEKYKTKTTVWTPRVVPHNFLGSTQCPGPHLVAKLDWLRDRAAQLSDGVALQTA